MLLQRCNDCHEATLLRNDRPVGGNTSELPQRPTALPLLVRDLGVQTERRNDARDHHVAKRWASTRAPSRSPGGAQPARQWCVCQPVWALGVKMLAKLNCVTRCSDC